VLTATGVAPSFTEAQRISRETADSIHFDGKVFRHDIGWREAARLEARRPIGAPQRR
jgi:phosphoribosylamine--glycine ligase